MSYEYSTESILIRDGIYPYHDRYGVKRIATNVRYHNEIIPTSEIPVGEYGHLYLVQEHHLRLHIIHKEIENDNGIGFKTHSLNNYRPDVSVRHSITGSEILTIKDKTYTVLFNAVRNQEPIEEVLNLMSFLTL